MRERRTKTAGRIYPKMFSVLLAGLLAGTTLSYGQQKPKANDFYGPQAHSIVPGAEFVRVKADNALPATVRMTPAADVKGDEFISWLTTTLKPGEDAGFVLTEQKTDNLGFTHYRYVQTLKGIPIDKTTYIAHVKDGVVKSFNGLALEVPSNVVATPVLSEADALKAGLQFVGAKKYKWEDEKWTNELRRIRKDPNASYYPKGQLVWVVSRDNKSYTLAYRFDINAAVPDREQRIYVDARTGSVIQTLPLESNCEPPANFNSIFNGARSIRTDEFTGVPTYRLLDDCQSPNIYIRDWGGVDLTNNMTEITSSNNTWTGMNQRFGATVQWQAKESYLYFLNVHGRNSYDDAGGNVNGYINAMFDCSPPAGCITANNASMSFSGQTMKVGLSSDGVLSNSYATLDIIGHEFAHAVTSYASGLVYQDESGALNESFSDIFGEMVENRTLGSNDWLLGDERDDGAIRDMSDPNNFNDPDTYNGTFWFTGTGDNGGVHTNSGVQNFWFYLLSVGGTGTNDNSDEYDVEGIGIVKARNIAYRNVDMYLGANSDYSDARDGAIQAAIDLYGICSDEVKQTTNAWYAVGVGDQYFNATASTTSNYNGADVSCNGSCDGAANVVPANGNSPYTYSWNTGPTTASISNLCAGTYTVTVTDDDGCVTTASVTLTDPPLLTVTATATSDYNGYNVSCNGGSDGVAEAFPAGGTGAYSYAWNDANAQTTKSASGLLATTYNVVVTDANGCTANDDVTLTEPTPLTIDAGENQTVYYGYPDSSCADLEATGISGGVTNVGYTITWSTSSNDAAINVCPVTSTTYYVTVTDANGCSATDSVRVCVIDVRCGNKLDKVTICHTNSGSSNPLTLCVKLEDVAVHLATHGDQLAECGIDKSCNYPAGARYATFIPGSNGETYLAAIPNPFANKTAVRFSLNENTRAKLIVYDLTGKELTMLFDEAVVGNNMYEVTFDGNKWPAGVYTLVLKTESGQSHVRKIVMTK